MSDAITQEREEAARALGNWLGILRPSLENWEAFADEFLRETGVMRPGKDDARGIHTDQERWDLWNNWSMARRDQIFNRFARAFA